MNKDLIIFYILIGIGIAAIIERGYDKRRNGIMAYRDHDSNCFVCT